MVGRGRREREEINWMIAHELPALRRYANILLRGGEKMDDLVQDTLERAMKKSHTWRRDGNIRSWLYRIQYTVFLNHYADSAPVEIPAQTAIDITGEYEGQQAQESRLNGRRVLDAVHQLPAAHRDVLLLVAAQGCSYDETARIMDIPVGTVRSRLARARSELRAMLGDTGHYKKSRDNGKEEL